MLLLTTADVSQYIVEEELKIDDKLGYMCRVLMSCKTIEQLNVAYQWANDILFDLKDFAVYRACKRYWLKLGLFTRTAFGLIMCNAFHEIQKEIVDCYEKRYDKITVL